MSAIACTLDSRRVPPQNIAVARNERHVFTLIYSRLCPALSLLGSNKILVLLRDPCHNSIARMNHDSVPERYGFSRSDGKVAKLMVGVVFRRSRVRQENICSESGVGTCMP
jgi:hypothetical protein